MVVGLLAGCGGTSTTTTVTCRDVTLCPAQEAVLASAPTGSNTTEILVDAGPSFQPATNVPYVTVSVCQPGTTTCATIDRVILDTGSYGLRVLRSAVGAVPLAPVVIPADGAGTFAGNLAECYPFVIGGTWGPVVTADVLISGETAPSIPIQLIDDSSPANPPLPSGCKPSPASQLQANGILGVGVVGLDCGVQCLTLPETVYYSCPAGINCTPAAVPGPSQIQNPVPKFQQTSDGFLDNNGTMIVMPPLPALGAVVAKGRLVFGIGTRPNNQLPPSPTFYKLNVAASSLSPEYLSVTVQLAGGTFVGSYIDSGANGYFFDTASIPRSCKVTGGVGEWYCPASTTRLAATMSDYKGTVSPTFDIPVANADELFSAGGAALANLGGSVGQPAETAALGLPFFYGRTVYTAIWFGSLSLDGPWYSF